MGCIILLIEHHPAHLMRKIEKPSNFGSKPKRLMIARPFGVTP